ncbi:MAG: hypothetical protein ACOC83_09210 [Gemmatimonadota bacterium]
MRVRVSVPEASTAVVRRLRPAVLALAAVVALPAVSYQQAARSLDDATFRIHRDDVPTARERFALRSEGGAMEVVGRLTWEGEGSDASDVAFELLVRTDEAYRPQFFQLRSDGSGDAVGQRSGERIRVRVATDRGDRWTEMVAPPDVSVIEPRLAHHYQLLLRQHADALEASGEHSGQALVPSAGERLALEIRRTEAGPAAAGGRASNAYEVRVGSVTARIWADDEGRVWRLEIPEQSWIATRTEEGT